MPLHQKQLVSGPREGPAEIAGERSSGHRESKLPLIPAATAFPAEQKPRSGKCPPAGAQSLVPYFW